MLIRARHKVYGVHLVPEAKVRLWPDLWERVDDTTPTAAEEARMYEPAGHRLDPVDDDDGVLAYLASADDTERARVIDAERARGPKARKTVLDWQPPAE